MEKGSRNAAKSQEIGQEILNDKSSTGKQRDWDKHKKHSLAVSGNRYFLIHPKPGTIWPSILQ